MGDVAGLRRVVTLADDHDAGVMEAEPRDSRHWLVRPIVWFAAAWLLTTILHEFVHASTAFALGVRSTLYNYSARLALTPVQAASHAPLVIGVAGPLSSLAFGTLTWFLFRRAGGSAAALPLLYLSVFAAGAFFGNLMSVSFVGDFSAAAAALRLPMTARHGIAVAGALSVAALHFWAGRELVRWVPVHIGRVIGVLGIIVLPAVVGVAVVILVNQPIPAPSVYARIAEAGFWLCAAVGAAVAGPKSEQHRVIFAPRWSDGAVILGAILAVRLMVGGIPFTP